ncbi:MAG: NUDIX domain-containing protein [Chloroflexaceae bacterium]|jgi:8-oxo-dGTP pyrophosphatase MutT (NUDIX family)|nr:NUDIX domain-containing protein [Chloroflexaceae bacterium]
MQSTSTISTVRDRLLTTTYNLAIVVRDVVRRILRPTEMGVRALVVRGDEVLMICHRGGSTPWSLPGGGVKAGETLEDAARREVMEEAGCPVRVERLHGMYHNFSEGFNNYVAVYLCTPLGEASPPVGSLEIRTAQFVSLRELPDTTEKGSRRRVMEFLHGRAGLSEGW